MDFLLELLFEIILEGTLELGTNRKIPLVLRILALLVILALFGGITVLILFAGYQAIKEHNTLAGVFLLIVGFLMALGSIHMIIKRIRQRR